MSQSDRIDRPPMREAGTPRALACVQRARVSPRALEVLEDAAGARRRSETTRERRGTHHLLPPESPTLDDLLCDPLDERLVLVGGVDELDLDAEGVCEAAHVVAAVVARGEREDVDVVEPVRGCVEVVLRGGLLELAAVGEGWGGRGGGRVVVAVERGRERGEGEERGDALCRGRGRGVSRCGQEERQDAQERDCGCDDGDRPPRRG